MADLPTAVSMFNDIVAAARATMPHPSFGLAFADLYTVEGAARIDALFIDALRAADPALAARLAAARSATGAADREGRSRRC